MTPGTRAVVLDETDEVFLVRSPEGQGDQSGWVSKSQFVRTFYQDIKSNQRCIP